MESTEKSNILDLSKSGLKKMLKTDDSSILEIILDQNDLQKLENIDSFKKIEKLSVAKNQLTRMYGVGQISSSLKHLNLSFNGILQIEALKDLTNLTYLNLEGNNIKTIEHLNTNLKLEFVNLSENSIGIISDISFLKCLKELFLHGNRICHMRQCEKYLPTSLETLTLAKNCLKDLNELSTLCNLVQLSSITLHDNPCLEMIGGNSIGFDYRPFALNWCMNLKVIDGFVVNPIESLKAEWLYSQGKGRSFRIGEQQALAFYLSQACPLSGEALENENERKLRLILSKAQQHQRQLQIEQIVGSDPAASPTSSTNNSPSSLRRKGPSRIQSPRITRLGGRPSDGLMSTSYHGSVSPQMSSNQGEGSHSNHLLEMTKSLIENFTKESIMTQSLDPNILSNARESLNLKETAPINGNLYNDQTTVPIVMNTPLVALSSKMMPVLESLMSPDCPGPLPIIQQRCSTKTVGVSSLTTSTTNYVTSSTVKTVKAKETYRGTNKKDCKSGTIKSPRLLKKTSSPTVSPRKSISNTTNSKLHHNQLQQIKPSQRQQMLNRYDDTGSSGALSTGDEEDEDDSDKINLDKLRYIRKTAQKCQKQKENQNNTQLKSLNGNKATEESAILIQKLWRGYSARKRNQSSLAEILQKKRTQEYIVKLSKDMEMTKQALENERKIQKLQMQAINALWKKVSSLSANEISNEPVNVENITFTSDSVVIVQNLTQTCASLTIQVEQLQTSMRDILNCMTVFATLPQSGVTSAVLKDSSETQTEIIAVHTPQVDPPAAFPFSTITQKHPQRPSSLPITNSSNDSSSCRSSQNNTAETTNTDDLDGNLSTAIVQGNEQSEIYS